MTLSRVCCLIARFFRFYHFSAQLHVHFEVLFTNYHLFAVFITRFCVCGYYMFFLCGHQLELWVGVNWRCGLPISILCEFHLSIFTYLCDYGSFHNLLYCSKLRHSFTRQIVGGLLLDNAFIHIHISQIQVEL